MQPVLLVNPTGGHKHAYHPDELKADLEHGWEVVGDKQEEQPKEPEKRKPGRPPKAK
jgi:hypothetical protein